MVVLLDTSEKLEVCEQELGCKVEQLFTPLTGFRPQKPHEWFAIDNGAFSLFDPNRFRACLAKHTDRKELCRFVAVPDVVGSAIRTREVFDHWQDRLGGWRLAYVVQDGQEYIDIPWKLIDAVFIGGTTKYKLSDHVKQIVKAAKICEKWVHAGRVNTPARFEYFEKLGCDSIDGTGLSRYTWMRESIYSRDKNLFSCTCDLTHTTQGCPRHGDPIEITV